MLKFHHCCHEIYSFHQESALALDPSLSVTRLCVARDLTHLAHETETVHDLGDLNRPEKLDPDHFFETTFVTSGMASFISEVFGRFTKTGGSPVICLSQSMGGGKTHNLLAAGLLAKHPSFKHKIDAEAISSVEVPEGIRVLSFSGREHNDAFWESFAQQMGKKDHFRDREGRLIIPTPESWMQLFGYEKVLILLDEIPPYFHSIANRGSGVASICSVSDLTSALVSLFGAAGRSQSLVVVYTDLDGAVYKLDSKGATTGIMDLAGAALTELRTVEAEASRVVKNIQPIKLGSDEFFGVLRSRLFAKVPDSQTIEKIADLYLDEYKMLKKAGRFSDTSADADFKDEIVKAYPFHPKWKDMYARLSNNPNFQQTRGLLRLVGAQVREAFERGRNASLLGPQHLPVGADAVHRQLMQLNEPLAMAIATDVVSAGATKAHATQRDELDKLDGLATEVATLILVASLPNSGHIAPGIAENDLLRTFIGPDRDFNKVAQLIQADGLPSDFEYLHLVAATKRFVFKSIANPNAQLRKVASQFSESEVTARVKGYLEKLFEPKSKKAYQAVVAFPAVEDIKLNMDKTLLVIEGGQPSLDPEYRAFYEDADFKNRVLFLVNSRKFDKLLDDARYHFAAQDVSNDVLGGKDSDAFEVIMKTKEAAFHTTVQSTYNSLFYPSSGEPSQVAVATKLVGCEALIEDALVNEEKLWTDATDKRLSMKIERLMNPRRLKWSSIKQKMARDPDFPFVPEAVLEEVKAAHLASGAWRYHKETDEVEKGPFQDKASLRVELTGMDDQGNATIRLHMLGADKVHWSEHPTVTRADAIAPEQMTTSEPVLYFFPIHSKGTFIDGDVFKWVRPALPEKAVREENDTHTGRVKVAMRHTVADRQSATKLLESLSVAATAVAFTIEVLPAKGRTLSISGRNDHLGENPWSPSDLQSIFGKVSAEYATDNSENINLKVTEVEFHNKAMSKSFSIANDIEFSEDDYTYVR